MVTAIMKLFMRKQQPNEKCMSHALTLTLGKECTLHNPCILLPSKGGCHHPIRQGERRKVVVQRLCTKAYKWLCNCRHCVTRPCALFRVHVSPRTHNLFFYGTRPLKFNQACSRESVVDALCCLWALACQYYIAVIMKLLMHTASSMHTCVGVIIVFFWCVTVVSFDQVKRLRAF